MRYFHRTTLSSDAVLEQADTYFGSRLASAESANRSRSYSGAIGHVKVAVRAEGGHYTHVTVETDQVGESEVDKLAKRFLAIVHRRADPSHELRGAY